MSTTLHSFIDIFEPIVIGEEKIQIKKIAIPLIQRDYAQGRIDVDVNKVRDSFLTSLRNAVKVNGNPITLDFIYGDIDDRGTMTPLDGQQRLTTLFLLHWYAAKKENISEDQYTFLGKFSYETRYSARYFCEKLVESVPSSTLKLPDENTDPKLSDRIINQAWFPLDWKKDPTISAMLVMLDAIHEKFKKVPEIWKHLKNRAITFYFLPIKDLGLTDELYIKMNSRGKPLTTFEHFKAELERKIRAHDEETAERIMLSIDTTWTDLLWKYRNGRKGDEDDNIIDDKFLRYFKFVCRIICYRNGRKYDSDVFNLLRLYFSSQKEPAEIITKLESFFNCWCDIDGFEDPTKFLESFMSYKHETGKITVYSESDEIDIFDDCLHNDNFPLYRTVFLYAITVYLQHQSEVTKEDFVKRIRVINNLIQYSKHEISERLRIPAILQAIDDIILKGVIDDTLENNFNVDQLREEKDKAVFLDEHPELADALYSLEDHKMLKGQISIIGLEDHPDGISFASLGTRFASLFNCTWDKIDRALMACGNYGQQVNDRLYQYASKTMQCAWDNLFHKSANNCLYLCRFDDSICEFDNTKRILRTLLSKYENFDDSVLDRIADEYIESCEKKEEYPWEYYYIKYPIFRPGSYGKLYNESVGESPYLFSVMQTPERYSSSTYMPYLKEADEAHYSTKYYGQLIYSNIIIECKNASYEVMNEDRSPRDNFTIDQNAEGIDCEDRIVKLKNYIKKQIFIGSDLI